jgi:hypothetical protein
MSAPTWEELTGAIEAYVNAHPDQWDKVVDFAKNHGPKSPRDTLPDGTIIMKDANEWYQELVRLGKGRYVLSNDQVKLRAFGYSIYDETEHKTHVLLVALTAFKSRQFPTQVAKWFKTPAQRAKFGELVSQGKAPPLPS